MGNLERYGIFGRWIFWMTLVYLVCELAFSASLLDLCSREASMDEIDALERIGRLLTGIAVALLFIGVFIDKDRGDVGLFVYRIPIRVDTKIALVLFYVATCTFINYQVQDWYVDSRTKANYGSASDRKNAFLLSLAGRSLANGTLRISSIHQPEVLAHTPSMKAFVALFPALAFNYPDVQKEIDKLLHEAIELNVKKPCPEGYDIKTCLGSPEQFNNNVWPQIVHSMEEGYAKYVSAYNDTVSRTSKKSLDASAEQAWQQYLSLLRSNKVRNPKRVPAKYYPKVRKEVRNMGVPVPDTWKPSDRNTFESIVRRKTFNDTWAEFGKQAGTSTPTKLMSIQQFVLTPKMQSQLHEKMGLEHLDLNIRIPLVTKFADVERQVYQPIAARIIDRKQKEVDSNPDSFMGMTDLGKKADTAVRTLVVVPLALLMSLLGGAGHTIKLLTITGRHYVPGKGRKPLFIALSSALVIVGCAIKFLYGLPNPLVDTTAFQALSHYTQSNDGYWYELGLEFIVRLQEFAYPFNATLHEKLPQVLCTLVAAGLMLISKNKTPRSNLSTA